jgi:hypothetical protein
MDTQRIALQRARESIANDSLNGGMSCTPEDRAALSKVSAGQKDISQQSLRRLFMLGLVKREFGVVCLTPHGLRTLGRAKDNHLQQCAADCTTLWQQAPNA